MSITTIPCGYGGPHILTDFMFSRPCKACDGEGTESYFSGEVMRGYREEIWGKRSLRRMAREIQVSPSSLSDMERGVAEFDEDTARRFLTALGIL